MLDHHAIEGIVRSQVDPGSGLTISRSDDADHYLSLAIRVNPSRRLPAHPERVEARIVTDGVDTFLLDLDGQFEYRDIDWDSSGQRQILTLLTMLAQAYLAGEGREGERRGFFGRRHSELTLELDGETYACRRTSP